MSMQDLPVEIFLQIVVYLPEMDKECLRITCRSLRQLVPVSPYSALRLYDASRYHFLLSSWPLKPHRFEFLRRLTLPGNIFSDRDVFVCSQCLKFRPTRDMPVAALSIGLHGGDLCEVCLLSMLLRGRGKGECASLYGVRYYSCLDCGIVQPEDIMWWHCNHQGDGPVILCASCHNDQARQGLGAPYREYNCKGCRQGSYFDAWDMETLARCGCDLCSYFLSEELREDEIRRASKAIDELERDIDYCAEIKREMGL